MLHGSSSTRVSSAPAPAPAPAAATRLVLLLSSDHSTLLVGKKKIRCSANSVEDIREQIASACGLAASAFHITYFDRDCGEFVHLDEFSDIVSRTDIVQVKLVPCAQPVPEVTDADKSEASSLVQKDLEHAVQLDKAINNTNGARNDKEVERTSLQKQNKGREGRNVNGQRTEANNGDKQTHADEAAEEEGEGDKGDCRCEAKEMEGKFYGNDGSWYQGRLKEGLKDGEGEYRWADGDWYRGEWKADLRDGEGEFHFGDDGSWYRGGWKADKKEGMGQTHFPDGDWMEGVWVDDKEHGPATYHFADGRTEQGLFLDGTRQSL